MALPIRLGATHKVVIGPAVAVGDGFTPITTLDVSTSDEAEAILHNNGTVVDISAYTFAAVAAADGYYHLTLQSGITSTAGHLTIVINDDSLCLPVKADFIVMSIEAYDSLYAATSTLITTADIGLLYESSIDTVTGQQEFVMTTAFAVIDSWIGCECSLEDVSTGEFYSGNIWISDSVAATNSLLINAVFPVTVVATDVIRIYARQHASYALNTYDPPTRTEATSDTSSILSKLLAYVRLMTRSDGFVDTDDATELTAINADGGSGVGNFDPEVDSLEAQADVSTAARLAELDAANLPADIDSLVTSAATAQADLDIITGGTGVNLLTATQASIDSIEGKANSLTFTVAGQVDANMQSVDDILLAESGTGAQGFGGA